MLGKRAQTTAAAPLTCGAAKEVPLMPPSAMESVKLLPLVVMRLLLVS